MAFRSSHGSSQALMRWLFLSSEVQLSFECMVPWLPPSPTPWFPEELPWELLANWREIETLLNCLKLCFQRRLTPNTSLWHCNSSLQSCPNRLHLLYHLMLMTTPSGRHDPPISQKRNSRIENTGINTSPFSLQSPWFFSGLGCLLSRI